MVVFHLNFDKIIQFFSTLNVSNYVHTNVDNHNFGVDNHILLCTERMRFINFVHTH